MTEIILGAKVDSMKQMNIKEMEKIKWQKIPENVRKCRIELEKDRLKQIKKRRKGCYIWAIVFMACIAGEGVYLQKHRDMSLFILATWIALMMFFGIWLAKLVEYLQKRHEVSYRLKQLMDGEEVAYCEVKFISKRKQYRRGGKNTRTLYFLTVETDVGEIIELSVISHRGDTETLCGRTVSEEPFRKNKKQQKETNDQEKIWLLTYALRCPNKGIEWYRQDET